jgi:predicted ATP-dependent endonuclease of OLD family
MTRIRQVEITNYRGIKHLLWSPSPGINCLIGPGDSGKSTILDAIDGCLGARRTLQFSDADFYNLDVATEIGILVTIGDLDDKLKDLDRHGVFLRGFNSKTSTIEDEPNKGLETVLTVALSVSTDLDPTWQLFSERGRRQDITRTLSANDRNAIATTRLGAIADYHLGWRRGSILNRLSDERPDASAAIVKAARDARTTFGKEAAEQLKDALATVTQTANELGVPVGATAKALLDAHTVSVSDGTISLHNSEGIPLRGLGIGSTRLLIAGLQRKAVEKSAIILIDELEYGLEPHRIARLLGSLGAKDASPPLQAFVTTHSPTALVELGGDQLFVVRTQEGSCEVKSVGTSDDVQGTIRKFPSAFLAPSVVICEGASEVGLIRGLDQFRANASTRSIAALGVALVDSGGGDADKPFARATTFHALGYRMAVIRDDDVPPTPATEKAFKDAGGFVVSWHAGRALEDELFMSMDDASVAAMIDYAIALHGEQTIDEQIKTASNGRVALSAIRADFTSNSKVSIERRQLLANAAKFKKHAWFKSVTAMEGLAKEIIGPNLSKADTGFQELIDALFTWAADAGT